MSLIATNLLGQHVFIPDEGDSGTVCAVFTDRDGWLKVLVHRENRSQDFRIYDAEQLTTKREE